MSSEFRVRRFKMPHSELRTKYSELPERLDGENRKEEGMDGGYYGASYRHFDCPGTISVLHLMVVSGHFFRTPRVLQPCPSSLQVD